MAPNHSQPRIVGKHPVARCKDRILGRAIRVQEHKPLRVVLVVAVVGIGWVQWKPTGSRLGDMGQDRTIVDDNIREDWFEYGIVRHQVRSITLLQLHSDVLVYLYRHRTFCKRVIQYLFGQGCEMGIFEALWIKCGAPCRAAMSCVHDLTRHLVLWGSLLVTAIVLVNKTAVQDVNVKTRQSCDEEPIV